MTEEDTSLPIGSDSSRRSFMKKGAVASGALALGMAGASTGAAQQNQNQNALVFSYQFYPGSEFTISAPLQQSTTIDILQGPEDEGVPEISQPDEYNGYVIGYQIGNSSIFTFVFVRGQSLQEGSTYSFGDQSQVFSPQLNLLQVPVTQEEGGNGSGGSNTTNQSN